MSLSKKCASYLLFLWLWLLPVRVVSPVYIWWNYKTKQPSVATMRSLTLLIFDEQVVLISNIKITDMKCCFCFIISRSFKYYTLINNIFASSWGMVQVSPKSTSNLCHIALFISRVIRKLLHKINMPLLTDIANNEKVYRHWQFNSDRHFWYEDYTRKIVWFPVDSCGIIGIWTQTLEH